MREAVRAFPRLAHWRLTVRDVLRVGLRPSRVARHRWLPDPTPPGSRPYRNKRPRRAVYLAVPDVKLPGSPGVLDKGALMPCCLVVSDAGPPVRRPFRDERPPRAAYLVVPIFKLPGSRPYRDERPPRRPTWLFPTQDHQLDGRFETSAPPGAACLAVPIFKLPGSRPYRDKRPRKAVYLVVFIVKLPGSRPFRDKRPRKAVYLAFPGVKLPGSPGVLDKGALIPCCLVLLRPELPASHRGYSPYQSWFNSVSDGAGCPRPPSVNSCCIHAPPRPPPRSPVPQ